MNKKLVRIFFFISALIGFAVSLYLFIKSYAKYSDEYGTDISFNEDYLIALFVMIIFTVYTAYNLFSKSVRDCSSIVGLSISALISFYSLGHFFKALFKALNKGKEFIFTSYQNYLYIGLFTLFIFIAYVIKPYQEFKNKTKE